MANKLFWKKIFLRSGKILLITILLAGVVVIFIRLPLLVAATNRSLSNDANIANIIAAQYATLNNNFEQAEAYLNDTLKDKNLDNGAKSVLSEQLLLIYIKAGDFDEALKLLPNLNIQSPRIANLAVFLVNIHQIKNHSWRVGNANLPDNNLAVVANVITAWGYASQKNFDAAFDELKKISSNGDDEIALAQVALLKLLNQQSISYQDFSFDKNKKKQLSQLSPAQLRILLRAFTETDRWQEAEQLLAELPQPLPLILLDDAARIAKRQALIPLVRNAADGLSYFLLDLAASFASKNIDTALIFCQLARMANENNPDANFLLASIYENLGLHESAKQLLRQGQKNPVYLHLANLALADLLQVEGQDNVVKNQLLSYRKEYPEIQEYLAALAILSMRMEEFKQAEKYYAELIAQTGKDNPNSWFFYFQHGVALERQKKWNEAEISLLQSLKLNPESPTTLNYLGYSWVDRKKNVPEALAMLKKALKLEPDNGAILDSVGWAYYKLDQLELARNYLEQAGNIIADDPEINEHLGDVYWRLGKKTAAILFWQKVLTAGEPSEEQKIRVEKKLKNGMGFFS